MSLFRERLHISTMDEQGAELARQNGLGLELADFCAAMNLDGEQRTPREAAMARSMTGLSRFVFHAPFCELTPCAVDPLIGEVSRRRYQQAFELAWAHGIRRMVVHSGFVFNVYYPEWYVQQAPSFWREFMADKPADFELLIENVLDVEPWALAQTVRDIGDQRVGLCLDLGHAAVYSDKPWPKWREECLPYLRHVHLHDNDGKADLHLPLGQGVLPLARWIEELEEVAPTYTLENMDAAPSLKWLAEQHLL